MTTFQESPLAQPLPDPVCLVLLQSLTSGYLCFYIWIMRTRTIGRGMGMKIK